MILPILSHLATLVMIPVLLTRLSTGNQGPRAEIHLVALKRLFRRILGNYCIDFCVESLVNKRGIVLSVAKSDEIGKITHLVCTRFCVRTA